MRTMLILSIPVVLIGGVGFIGVLLGAWLFRLGMRQGLALRSRCPAVASQAAEGLEIADDAPKPASEAAGREGRQGQDSQECESPTPRVGTLQRATSEAGAEPDRTA